MIFANGFAPATCTHSPETLQLTAGGPPQIVTYTCNGMYGLPPHRDFILKLNPADGINTTTIMRFGYPYKIAVSATTPGNYSLPIIDISVGGAWNPFHDPTPLQINVIPPQPTYPQVTAGSLTCSPTSITVSAISTCKIQYTNAGNGTATNVTITPSAPAGAIGSMTGCSTSIAANSSCIESFIYTAPSFIPFVNPIALNVTYADDQKETVAIGSTNITIANDLSASHAASLNINQGTVSGGQTITLNGAFGTNPSVTFDTNPATILSSSASHITLKTPPNTYTGGSGGKMVNVIITTSTGSITLPNAYTYVGLNDPYEGGVIFHLNTSGNPGGSIVSPSDYPASNNPILNWHQANTYCAHYVGGGYNNWRLPNTYAYNTTPTNDVISGEPSSLYNNGAPYAGMSMSNDYWGSADTTINPGSNNAWIENFGDGRQLSVTKSATASYLFTRCVRDFNN